ncbi:hypothetical protein GCM10025870_18840 [Agromyces marinus]|uniref:AB hydrolase-1 domain-containing protein n=2 Tax=Agromyces marinus TaxID=1389020 RepID=A0ABM8H1Z5_9MICO|nr:hypothetical protein GCM10025870_18840 [Agromyces marinus]
MTQAGVAPGEPIVVVGHSAGGIVAANLAADPGLAVVGAVSLGGPVVQVDTGGTPMVSVTHPEDLVPATGGAGRPVADRIDVQRSLGEVRAREGAPLPAHALTEYRVTAELIDESDDARLVAFRGIVDDLTRGEVPETTHWTGTRVPAEEVAGSGGGGV